MNVFGNTDLGRVRSQNQDCFTIMRRDEDLLAVVCDGMGGARSGNVASCMALEVFADTWKNATDEEPARILNNALKKANDAIFLRSLSDPECTGMGTTLVSVWLTASRSALSKEHAYVINVGDSRAYLIRTSGIRKITRDHSLVADLVERGKITPDEARNHPNKNIITRALGTERQTMGDLFELDLDPDDYLLLCSDGLSNMITDQELQYEVLYGGLDETCCHRLIEIALDRGAPDNVTAVLICPDEKDECFSEDT